MRPKPILYFEILFFATIALGILKNVLDWKDSFQIDSIGFVLSLHIGIVALLICLVLLISRRRSKIAMWVLITLTILGIPLVYEMVNNITSIGSLSVIMIQNIGQLIGIGLLFLPSSRRWLKNDDPAAALKDTFS